MRVYSDRLCEQLGKLHSRIEEIETAMERKNYTEMQKAQDRSAQAVERELIKLKRKELWIECISLIRFPIWLSMMETIRRMTGTGKQVPGLGLTDGLIPMEPSLATEGLLWIDDLSAPDPSLVLPFALSGIMFVTYIFGRGSFCVYLVPKTAEKKVRKKHSWAWRYVHSGVSLLAFALKAKPHCIFRESKRTPPTPAPVPVSQFKIPASKNQS